ncbi:hypothetical protein [Bacillus atrophaeus]|uniref:hypothetical protein n=1 Tax=Bacillus atrophaeus TaxID=1452 RepID=UPI002E1B853F|nr:hypothetical protein [Bacillus atrophaeus]MED4814213.1 hypothetical protein [Bacillus atrophaeus]MED4826293.1 hypothetical protein [Bacillus atrophaeus]MED4844953.1 hypothetical protein [Bacillus atrophaeus]
MENMSGMLIKFLRPEHVSEFLDGSLHFTNTGYFIDLEKEEETKGYGDKYEGHHFRLLDPKNDILKIELDGEFHTISFERGFSTESREGIRSLLLNCFTLIKYEDSNDNSDFYLDYYEDLGGDVYKVKTSILDSLEKEFEGRVPVLIHNTKLFMERFEAKTANIRCKKGPVVYFDEYSNYPLSSEEVKKDFDNTLFYKRKFYENQKEFRIILENPKGLDNFKIDIGDLRGCARQLESVQDLRGLFISTEQTEEHSV